MRIRICWETGDIEGELTRGATAEAIYAALPCSAEANTWGDEVYFSLEVPASTRLKGVSPRAHGTSRPRERLPGA